MLSSNISKSRLRIASIGNLATDSDKRMTFRRLADDYRAMAENVRIAISRLTQTT